MNNPPGKTSQNGSPTTEKQSNQVNLIKETFSRQKHSKKKKNKKKKLMTFSDLKTKQKPNKN